MQAFSKDLIDLIKNKGKQLNKKKKQAIKRIKEKDITKTCFNYFKHAAPINKCTNSKQLAQKEQEIIKEIEKLSSQAQADESERKRQEEKNKREREKEDKLSQEREEFLRLSSLILDSQDLATLEKNYQIVKNSPLYTSDKKTFAENENNKSRLDSYFDSKKALFTVPNGQSIEKLTI
jgi:hypothetical protein